MNFPIFFRLYFTFIEFLNIIVIIMFGIETLCRFYEKKSKRLGVKLEKNEIKRYQMSTWWKYVHVIKCSSSFWLWAPSPSHRHSKSPPNDSSKSVVLPKQTASLIASEKRIMTMMTLIIEIQLEMENIFRHQQTRRVTNRFLGSFALYERHLQQEILTLW